MNKQRNTKTDSLMLFDLKKGVPLSSIPKDTPCKLAASEDMLTYTLFFNPEDGRNTFSQNVCKLLPGKMNSQHRRPL
jgi:hypothetical protein